MLQEAGCAQYLGPTLSLAAQLSKTAVDVRVSQYGITPSQTRILLFLHQNGGQLPQCELTRCLRVKPSTVNGMLDRMEEKGLVRRSISGSDARRRLITLTEKGGQQHALFQRQFLDAEEALLRGFSLEEQTLFRSLLLRAIQNLEEDLQSC